MVLLQLPQTDLQIKDVFFSDGVFELLEVEQSVAEDVDAMQQRVKGCVRSGYLGRRRGRLLCAPTLGLSLR